MKSTVFLFLISLLLAIPTFGISIVLFFVIKYLVDKSSEDKILQAVVTSKNRGNENVIISYVNNAPIRNFFRKYGIPELPYQLTDGIAKGMYSCYVNIPNAGRIIAIIIKNNPDIIVSCCDAAVYLGNDELFIEHTRQLHNELTSSMSRQAGNSFGLNKNSIIEYFRGLKDMVGNSQIENIEKISDERIIEIYNEVKSSLEKIAESKSDAISQSEIFGIVRDLLINETSGNYKEQFQNTINTYSQDGIDLKYVFYKGRTYA